MLHLLGLKLSRDSTLPSVSSANLQTHSVLNSDRTFVSASKRSSVEEQFDGMTFCRWPSDVVDVSLNDFCCETGFEISDLDFSDDLLFDDPKSTNERPTQPKPNPSTPQQQKLKPSDTPSQRSEDSIDDDFDFDFFSGFEDEFDDDLAGSIVASMQNTNRSKSNQLSESSSFLDETNPEELTEALCREIDSDLCSPIAKRPSSNEAATAGTSQTERRNSGVDDDDDDTEEEELESIEDWSGSDVDWDIVLHNVTKAE